MTEFCLLRSFASLILCNSGLYNFPAALRRQRLCWIKCYQNAEHEINDRMKYFQNAAALRTWITMTLTIDTNKCTWAVYDLQHAWILVAAINRSSFICAECDRHRACIFVALVCRVTNTCMDIFSWNLFLAIITRARHWRRTHARTRRVFHRRATLCTIITSMISNWYDIWARYRLQWACMATAL